jgi:hypothetical protein
MKEQMKLQKKVLACFALGDEAKALGVRYQGVADRDSELRHQCFELRRQRHELTRYTKKLDEQMAGARIKYDSMFLALGAELAAAYLPGTRQEQ